MAGVCTLKEEGTVETSPLNSIRFIYGHTIRGRIDSTILGFEYSLGRHDALSKSRERLKEGIHSTIILIYAHV